MISYVPRTCITVVCFTFVLLLSLALQSQTVHAQEEQATSSAQEDTQKAVESNPSDGETPYRIETVPGGGVARDFVIGPGKVELEMRPGESKTIEIFVTNRTGEDKTFELSVEDAEGSHNTEQTVVLLGDKRGPYSLKDYISIPDTRFELAHNKRAAIPVTITIPKDAEPGGLYGSVLSQTVAVKGVNDTENLAPQSPIVARVGTLFFITIPGDTQKSGELRDFSTVPKQTWFQSGPIRFQILFENTGKIHLTPSGELQISNMFGEEVGAVDIEPWFALPGSLRLREIVWNREFLFGKYTATINLNRGYGDIVDIMEYSFWVLPWKIVAATLLALFLVIFFVRRFFKTFEFRRKEL